MASWKLSNLSHEEFSWQLARKRLKSDEDDNVELSVSSMMVDVTKRRAMNKKESLLQLMSRRIIV